MHRLISRVALALAVLALALGFFLLNPAPSAAATTLLSASGSIDTLFEVDTYGILLQEGMVIQVEMVCGTPNTLDTLVRLYDPSNNLVASDDDKGNAPCGGWRSSFFTYTVPVTGQYWLDATHSAFVAGGPYTLTVTVVAGPGSEFSGPGLPGPDGRNLVLFIRDTNVLSSPNGAPTGNVMKACQTAFIIASAEDGGWGEIFVMGGWIPVANTLDVPEDYGQNGEKDAALVPGCVGVLPYPSVPMTPQPRPTSPVEPEEPPNEEPNGQLPS